MFQEFACVIFANATHGLALLLLLGFPFMLGAIDVDAWDCFHPYLGGVIGNALYFVGFDVFDALHSLMLHAT